MAENQRMRSTLDDPIPDVEIRYQKTGNDRIQSEIGSVRETIMNI